MKVCLINGSPHKDGCTATALAEIGKTLAEEGIDSEVFWLGTKPNSGCTGCGGCQGKERCAVDGDKVNEFLAIAESFDGYIFGSAVHYAAATGAITSFLDRVFYAGPKKWFALKPGAAVVSARRAGTTAALDQLNKYFTISEMPVISSRYWNMVHGFTPDDVRKDEEGLLVMRTLARNMAWFLKCKEAGAKAGVPLPKREPGVMTNFIRYKRFTSSSRESGSRPAGGCTRGTRPGPSCR
jgi:multimeric flavodoxin WrbA